MKKSTRKAIRRSGQEGGRDHVIYKSLSSSSNYVSFFLTTFNPVTIAAWVLFHIALPRSLAAPNGAGGKD